MRHAAVYDDEDLVDSSAELNLGIGMLLGIFFGLALVCGVFFGFGYMMGHRSPGPYVSSEPLYVAPKAAETPAAPKPSALVPEQPLESSRVVLPTTSQANSSATPAQQTTQPVAPSAPEVSKPVIQKVATNPAPNPALTIDQPASTPSGAIMVQIAAVKNRPDAEALANALRKNGFTPAIRTEPQDKLLHVQIGPFSNRDEAKAMRQKLSSAGYDAFIK